MNITYIFGGSIYQEGDKWVAVAWGVIVGRFRWRWKALEAAKAAVEEGGGK